MMYQFLPKSETTYIFETKGNKYCPDLRPDRNKSKELYFYPVFSKSFFYHYTFPFIKKIILFIYNFLLCGVFILDMFAL